MTYEECEVYMGERVRISPLFNRETSRHWGRGFIIGVTASNAIVRPDGAARDATIIIEPHLLKLWTSRLSEKGQAIYMERKNMNLTPSPKSHPQFTPRTAPVGTSPKVVAAPAAASKPPEIGLGTLSALIETVRAASAKVKLKEVELEAAMEEFAEAKGKLQKIRNEIDALLA